MTGHLLKVFSYELRRNFRRKGYLFTTFGVPLLGIVLLLAFQFISSSGALGGGGGGDSGIDLPPGVNLPVNPDDIQGIDRAGYVDLADVTVEPRDDNAEYLVRYETEEEARTALEAGEIDVYYLIPADYLQTGDITTVMPRLSITQLDTSMIRRLLLRSLSQGIEPELAARVANPANIQQISLSAPTDDEPQMVNEGASFLLVYVFAIILLVSLFFTNGYLMQSVIEEKETRLIEILLATVRPINLLVGKILAMGLLGLLQVGAWIGGIILAVQLVSRLSGAGTLVESLATIASVNIPLNMLPLIFVYFLLAYLLFAALYGMVGAISNSMREGPQYAVVFTLPAVIPLYFVAIFASTPDAPLPTILSLIPITAPIAMIQRLLITTVPAWQIIVSLGGLALSCLLVLWLSARLFRVQTLLAGQAPKLRDIPRLLRG